MEWKMKKVMCMACSREAICDDEGNQLNFCSQSCSESNIEYDHEASGEDGL